jgi:hypothetical protein
VQRLHRRLHLRRHRIHILQGQAGG